MQEIRMVWNDEGGTEVLKVLAIHAAPVVLQASVIRQAKLNGCLYIPDFYAFDVQIE